MRGIALSNMSSEARKLVSGSFSAFLEASIHSQGFRESLVEAEVLPSLLQRLLLEESHVGSRHGTATIIQGICLSNSK